MFWCDKMEEEYMSVEKAIKTGKMCEDCIYYNDCYYDRDCIAMAFLKWTVEMHENVHRNNTRESGDKA